jgi:RNA polymerase sigma factor (sigma-70 family)
MRPGRRFEELRDGELVARCLRGEARSWEELVRRYRRLVYAVPRRMRLRHEDAEEVLQDTFTTLLEKLAALRDHERLGAWLVVVAQRRALALLQRGARPREVALPDSHDAGTDPGALPLEELVRLERQDAVQRALEQLPERCRALLAALYFEDPTPSYREIARRLGVREGSLGPTRQRCFEKLRRRLAALGHGGRY